MSVNTSPVKRGHPRANSAKEKEAQIETSLEMHPFSPHFVEEHLNTEHQDQLGVFATDPKVVKLAQNYTDVANDRSSQFQYPALTKLLNYISDKIHKYLAIEQKNKIKFIDHHDKPLHHSPNRDMSSNSAAKPDIIAILAAVLDSVPKGKNGRRDISWHHLLSPVEEKSDLEQQKLRQTIRYIGIGNQARPDRLGMYGLSVSIQGYHILYSDPSGYFYSHSHPLNDLLPLVQYVFTLYRPRSDRVTEDPSIQLSPATTNSGEPLWDITFQGSTYKECRRLFVGEPNSRMTWVASAKPDPARNGGHPFTIKDSYLSHHRRWREDELLKHLHSEGDAPGWVQIEAAGFVTAGEDGQAKIETPIAECRRVKTRLVMKTSGEAPHKCDTLVKFLRAMYDVIEAHRWAVRERRIMHRDISPMNILVNPTGHTFAPSDDVKFIDEIMPPISRPQTIPNAVLCDLDNGCRLDQMDSSGQRELKARTGTPMYIARSVARGRLELGCGFTPMCSLSEPERDWYCEAHKNYPKDTMRVYEDQGNLTHGGTFNFSLFQASYRDPFAGYRHRPRHDIESVYWTIVARLLRAKPRNAADDAHISALQKFFPSLSEHEIGGGHDHRKCFLDSKAAHDWNALLHPDLAHCGNLLEELSLQIEPEYAFLEPPVNELHLHEAVQRILIKYISLFEREGLDVELDVEEFRPVLIRSAKEPEKFAAQDMVGSKRKAGTDQRSSKKSKQSVNSDDEPPLIPTPRPVRQTAKESRLKTSAQLASSDESS